MYWINDIDNTDTTYYFTNVFKYEGNSLINPDTTNSISQH